MITYSCPKCGEVMSSPGSMSGQSETCPRCGNMCSVPFEKHVAQIARTVDKTATILARIKAFCVRRKKLVAIVIVNFVLLTGFVGWLLPGWLPRPVLTFETPSEAEEGVFPSRADLAKILKSHGYYPLATESTFGILRGRRLKKYYYTSDVNYPERTSVSVWCPLEDTNCVIAISTVCDLDMSNLKDKSLSSRNIHAAKFTNLITEICGKNPSDAKYIRSEVGDFSAARGTKMTEYYSVESRGFQMERINSYRKVVDSKQMKEPVAVFILKDKNW